MSNTGENIRIYIDPAYRAEIRYNFETGLITILAPSEEDIPRAMEEIKRRGWA